jgi:hypothetical protein
MKTTYLAALCLGSVTFGVWSATIYGFAFLPTAVGANVGADWRYLVPWMPGIAIAILSGSAGALFKGLVDLRTFMLRPTAIADGAPTVPFEYALRPVLGALGGVAVFALATASQLSLASSTTGESKSAGQLLWELTPTTTQQFATWILMTFAGGAYFDRVASVLGTRLDKL